MSNPLRDILYVDDEPNNLFVFEATFECEFRVHTATSAAEALTILDETPVPVVVADQRMPEMTGVEMFSILRRRHPHIQRIILSGYTESDAIIDAVNEGQVFQFVRKPWERSELHTVLRRALDAHDLATQNSRMAERLASVERMASLGHLAAEIAHEMGNQLMLLPLVELIEDAYSSDPQLLELASMARQTHERLETLVDEIKNFVRHNTGQDDERTPSQLQSRPVNLADCVRELLSFLRFHRTIPVKQIQFHCNSEVVLVMGDSFKLQQVLVNLITNASDAIAGKSDGCIEIELESTATGACLSVCDNGCGIDPEALNQIWDSFYTTKGSSGTGLGLEVVRNIVQAHGGNIKCTSHRGQGTTFTMRLPRIMEMLPAQAIPGLGKNSQ
ncbi:MAG: response regulator [Planctomycetaceae bacterium]|nr:response regulator [Planctomycetaceae bacterium]